MSRITRVRNFTVTVAVAFAEESAEGDAQFRKVVFGRPLGLADGKGPLEITERVAISLGDGFSTLSKGSSALGGLVSFADLCLDYTVSAWVRPKA